MSLVRSRGRTNLLILGAIIGAGLFTGNGIALSVAGRTGAGAAYLAGILAMAATFGVESLLAVFVVRVDQRIRRASAGGVSPVDLRAVLAILALATLGGAAAIRGIAWVGIGSFVGWSRFLPAATFAIAMGLSLAVPASERPAWHRVIVSLFVVQLALTAAVRFL
jgi:hypothetical protein